MPRTNHTTALTRAEPIRPRLTALLAVTMIAVFVFAIAQLILAGIRPQSSGGVRRVAGAPHVVGGAGRSR